MSSDYMEEVERDRRLLRGLQEREVALKEREQKRLEEDFAGYPERQRESNHHDIMARVVMMLLSEHASDWTKTMVVDAVRCARLAADTAYPPLGESDGKA